MRTIKLLFFLVLASVCSVLAAQQYTYQYDDDDADAENTSTSPVVEIQTVEDFSALGRLARAENKVIFLEVSASYCGWCRTLEEHIIRPMIISGDYDEYVLFRKINIDSSYPMKGFDGRATSPAKFAFRFDASLTPTLLFLGPDGQELSERIVGVNTLELYGEYVDIALAKGHAQLVN